MQIAYPCKRSRRVVQQGVSVAGSLHGTGAPVHAQLRTEASKPEPATVTSDPSLPGCSPCASAAVGAADCGAATTGSASGLQQEHLWEQRLAPVLTTYSSGGLPVCSVLEPQTPAETPPQLSRAFTAEGPGSCRASPQQPGRDAPSSAQAWAAQGMARQGAQLHGSAEGVSDGRATAAKEQGPCSTRKAPKLALRIVPRDTETAEHVEAQGMLAYFELSCRWLPVAATCLHPFIPSLGHCEAASDICVPATGGVLSCGAKEPTCVVATGYLQRSTADACV